MEHALRTQEVKSIEDFPVDTIRYAMLTAEEQDELSMPELHQSHQGSERKQFGMKFRMLGKSSLRVVECCYEQE